MKTSVIASAALAAGLAYAVPVEKRQSTNIDVTVLQFALTLEHLENVFYKQALKNYTAADFTKLGLPATYYENLQSIAFDEQSHTEFLSTALKAAGQTPTAACKYSFPATTAQQFLTLSSVLEGVGTSAYLGGAPLITSKDYLTAAGSILVDEALHTSLQRSAVGEVASANPYGTPLDPTSVYTLAATFIASCPSSNPALPFTPFPALAVKATPTKRDANWESWTSTTPCPSATPSAPKLEPSAPTAGSSITFSAAKSIPAGSFLTFISGLAVTSVAGQTSNTDITASIPAGTAGQSYVFVTSANVTGKFDDSKVLAGPAILEVRPAAPVIDFSES